MTSAAPETAIQAARCLMMSKLELSSQVRTLPTSPRPLITGRRPILPLDTASSQSTRATMSAETMEAMTPMERVTPNPLMGPEPRKNSSAAARSVVTLESMIAVHALLKPTIRARRSPADG